MRYSSRSVYGNETAAVHEDTDFDVGDEYAIPSGYKVHMIYHSHGSAHIEVYTGSAWVDLHDGDDHDYPGAGGIFRTVDGSPMARGAGTAGAMKVTGSGQNNTTLVVLMSHTVKTTG